MHAEGEMAHFISNGRPTNLVGLRVGAQADVQLWGDGPHGEPLDVTPSPADIVRVEEIPASFGPNLRGFSLRGLRQGSARLYARVGPGGAIWADTRVLVGLDTLNRYYHGTNSAIADLLIGADLTPMILASISPASVTMFDWSDYTDFGKGFYVHLEANKAMAYEWARRRFSGDWAVVEFIATPDELRDLGTSALLFQNKADRPHNSPRPVTVTTTTRSVELCPLPQVLPCVRVTRKRTTQTTSPTTLSWLEFVEHNRHIDPSRALIARPNDRDWTSFYSSIRGPIWVPRDSGYSAGLPVFPDHIHQLNWGLSGMEVLNAADAKVRRFKFSAQNEGLFPPPA
jgi:hypothetical protein